MEHSSALHPAEAGSDRRQAASFATPRKSLMDEGHEMFERDEQSLAEWESLVLRAVEQRYTNERTSEKVVAEAMRLFVYLHKRGVKKWDQLTANVVVEWCWAARRNHKTKGVHRRAATATARSRQWVARTVLQEARSLGALIEPAELIGVNIKRSHAFLSTRALTDDEAELVRVYADSGHVISRRALMVAFAFAGGTHSEIAAVRMCDVDVGAGTVAFSGEAARIGALDAWGSDVVRRYLRKHTHIEHDELLCTTQSADPAHSVAVRLGHVLDDAGLKGLPGVSARSIRLTTARAILDSDGIEAAALFLGSPSLDTTAEALGHRWRDDGDG